MMEQFKVAVIQAGAVPFDSQRSVEKACRLVAEAAQQGAKLIVFPEAFVSGYPKGLDFGARVGMRSPEGRSEFRRYWESAIEVPGHGGRLRRVAYLLQGANHPLPDPTPMPGPVNQNEVLAHHASFRLLRQWSCSLCLPEYS